jgi:hypothetical protein
MPTFKCTAIFNYKNADNRPGGWSESLYRTADTAANAINELNLLVQRRMGLASSGVVCVGMRASNESNPGISQVVTTGIKGQVLVEQDTPWQAVYIDAKTADGHRRPIILRGIGDGLIVGGILVPNEQWNDAFARWRLRMENNGWQLRGKNLANTPKAISDIDGTGNVTMIAALPLAPGDIIEFYRTRDVSGKSVIGSSTIDTVTDAKRFKLANWEPGRVVLKGKMRKLEYGFFSIASVQTVRVTLRKVGRPFFPYVGRR